MNKVASDFLYNDKSHLNYLAFKFADDNTDDYKLSLMKRALTNIIENSLPLKQKRYLTMYYFDGLTMPEIAELCGVNVCTVSRLIKKAVSHIKEQMNFIACT